VGWSDLDAAVSGYVSAPATDASMAYDARSQLVVLFGGGFSTPITNQTWAWNGTNWAVLTRPPRPARDTQQA